MKFTFYIPAIDDFYDHIIEGTWLEADIEARRIERETGKVAIAEVIENDRTNTLSS